MMYNLKLGGVLEKLSGLIIGQFTEYEEDCSLGKELYAALADLVKEYDYPVCFKLYIIRSMACGRSLTSSINSIVPSAGIS